MCGFEGMSISSTARWLSWLERRPVTAEVVGSNPIRVVILTNIFVLSKAEQLCCEENGVLAQLGEHLPYKQRVTGSSPVGPIKLWMVSRVAKGDRL